MEAADPWKRTEADVGQADNGFDFLEGEEVEVPAGCISRVLPNKYTCKVEGVALNLIHDEKEMKVLKQIEIYFNREGLIAEIPQTADPEEFEKLLVPS